MQSKRPWKALVAYASISPLAALMLVYQVGGILPVLLLMGVVLGAAHLAAVWSIGEDDETPADSSL